MVALARQTLLHEWRRFLPAMIAVGFAGLLQLLQAALVLGIFGSASVYIKGSSADLWVGYPGTQSVNLGRPIDAGVEMHLRMEPQVRQVEPFLWVDGDWRGARDTGGVSVYVSGIDTGPQGLMFDRVLPAALRARLQEVDTVDQWPSRARDRRHQRIASAGRGERRGLVVDGAADRSPIRPG